MTPAAGRGISLVRARVGMACGMILVLGSLTHLTVNVTGARITHPDLLLMYAALMVPAGLLGARRAQHRWRVVQFGSAALAVASVLALVTIHNQTAQSVARGATLTLLLAFSLPWASKPLRGALRNGLDAAQFGIGVFVASQLAAFGVGDLILIAWPDLAQRSWPFQ